MKVEVEVISNEIVKPSSPTPDHLRHYQLSFLDQSSPRFYSPVIFYYSLKDHNTISEVSIPNLLKKSLSNVLTQYYPLAGRLKNEGVLVCNDEGIPFLEARVKGQLSEVLNNPIASELNKFLPFELHEHNEVVLGVQLNVFDCGGIAIGACISDKLADALSCFRFLRTWAAIARRDDADVVCPEFVSAARFPPRTEPMIDSEACIMKKGIISKRFVFDTFTIEALREKYEQKENNIRPSRVETLSAFILSRFEAATNEVESVVALEKFYNILHTVHLRPRLDPPLFENSFGNYFKFAATLVPASTIKGEASITNGLVKNIREGIRKVDKEHLQKLQMGEDDEHLSQIKERSTTITARGGEVIVFEFTSLCRFPIYEADFGWGKPDWVSSASMNFDKLVAFMDNKTGDAIEAYVSLKEEHMAKLEADKEFLNYVSF